MLDKKIKIMNPLFQHQKELLNFAKERNSSFDCSETGIGKTLAAIALAIFRIRTDKIDDVIIVCPKSVQLTWEDELVKHLGFRPNNFYCFSYDLLRYHNNKCLPKIDHDRTLLILDESRYIKNGAAKRSQTILQLQKIQYKHFMDGTPIVTSPLDLFSPLKIANIWPFNKMTLHQFRQEYFRGGNLKYFKRKEFKDRIKLYMVRKEKKDCLDLPPKLYSTRWYEFTKEQERLYEQVRKKLRGQVLGEDGKMIQINTTHLSLLHKLDQLCSGFAYGDDAKKWFSKDNPKLDILGQLLDHLSGQQIAIWLKYDAEEEMIGSYLSRKKVLFASLTGSQSLTKRKANIEIFMSKKKSIMLCKIQSSSAGLNLQRANAVIYFSNELRGALRAQSEDRHHRPGVQNSVTYFDIFCKGRADELIKQKIDKQWSDAELIYQIIKK